AITALDALAESEHLDTADLRSFHGLCQRVVHAQAWTSIVLSNADGRRVLHTGFAPAPVVPASGPDDNLARARDERRPTVSNLFDGERHQRIVAVHVPVVRGNTVRWILSARLTAAAFGDVLRAQEFGPGSVAVLQDRDNVIIARTQGEAEMVGQRVRNPSPGREGWTRSRLREGGEVYAAFATAPLSGWRVVLTLPLEAVHGPLYRALWQMLAGAALTAALAGILTFVSGRRIAGAVGSLVRIARALERNDPVEPLRTGVTEVNVLADQLRAAADLARAREREAAVRERQARAMAEV